MTFITDIKSLYNYKKLSYCSDTCTIQYDTKYITYTQQLTGMKLETTAQNQTENYQL